MGTATPPQVAELGTLESTAFDRLFLQLMVRHHGGAIDMVAIGFNERITLGLQSYGTMEWEPPEAAIY